MKKGLIRCYRCDFVYEGRKDMRCPKCGVRMSSMNLPEQWHYSWRNFWRWLDGNHREPKRRKRRSSRKPH